MGGAWGAARALTPPAHPVTTLLWQRLVAGNRAVVRQWSDGAARGTRHESAGIPGSPGGEGGALTHPDSRALVTF